MILKKQNKYYFTYSQCSIRYLLVQKPFTVPKQFYLGNLVCRDIYPITVRICDKWGMLVKMSHCWPVSAYIRGREQDDERYSANSINKLFILNTPLINIK